MKRRRSLTERTLTAQRMTPGAGGGQTALPAPVAPRVLLPTVVPSAVESAAWASDGGVVVTDVSDPYEIIIGGTTVALVVNLTATLTGDTDIDVDLNGSTIGTVTVASGTPRGSGTFAETTVPGDVITLETTAAGTGTARAIAQMKIAK